MEIILLSGLALFSLSSIYFYFSSKDKLKAAFLVSFVTLISYTVMIEGSFITIQGGEELYWTRWIGYAISCSLLMNTIAKQIGFSGEEKARTIMLNVIVMLTGALASIYTGTFMLVMFAISSIAYVKMIAPILTHEKTTTLIKAAILCGWSVFPVVFILSHEGLGLIENTLAFSTYLLLDLFTKIIFYLLLSKE